MSLRLKFLSDLRCVKKSQTHFCLTSWYSDYRRRKLAPLQERRMVDRFRLWAKGGDGGGGCSSIRRSRHDRHGKADGGNGGRGGDVILECSLAVWDFSNLQHHLNAGRGGNGTSKNKVGNRGADKVAQVPVGTVVHLVSGEVPSAIISKSSTSLDPWDIPDSDSNDSSKPNHQMATKEICDSKRKSEKEAFHETPCAGKDKGKSSFHQTPQHNKMGSTTPARYSFYYPTESENEDHFTESDYTSELEFEEQEEEIEYSVAELTVPGQKLLVAQGGEGGLGNTDMSKTPKAHRQFRYRDSNDNDIPQLAAADDENESSLAQGLPGSEAVLILELKSIADVGLVGMPNAGKSTLLGAISRAKPMVGDYPFTTLRPNIGHLNYEDFFSVTVADIPGLIKGAHENRGLGHAFLRHIERTKALAYVVDLAAALDGKKGIPPWEQLRDLVVELEYHQEGLADRPSIVVANKIDEDGAEEVLEELKERVRGVSIYPLSAAYELGISDLKAGLRKLVDGGESGRLTSNGVTVD